MCRLVLAFIVLWQGWQLASQAFATESLAGPTLSAIPTSADISAYTARLRTEIESLSTQAANGLLQNPDFEDQDGGQITGWQFEPAPGAVVEIDIDCAFSGTQSMHLQSRSHVDWAGPVVSLRSKPFQVPTSRRLAVTAWLRVDPNAPTPSVWLVLEGNYRGQPFAHQLKVGNGQQAVEHPALSGDWMPLTLQLDELPLEGITDIRVGVDLRGTGDVWVDNMRIDNLWLTDDESQRIRSAADNVEAEIAGGRLDSARRILESDIRAELTQLINPDDLLPSLTAVSNSLAAVVEYETNDSIASNSYYLLPQSPNPSSRARFVAPQSDDNGLDFLATNAERGDENDPASPGQPPRVTAQSRQPNESEMDSAAVATMATGPVADSMIEWQEPSDSPRQEPSRQQLASVKSVLQPARGVSQSMIESESPLESDAKPRRWWSLARGRSAEDGATDGGTSTDFSRTTMRRPRSAPNQGMSANGEPAQESFSNPRSLLSRIWNRSSDEIESDDNEVDIADRHRETTNRNQVTMPRLGSPPMMAAGQPHAGVAPGFAYLPDSGPVEQETSAKPWLGFLRRGDSSEDRDATFRIAEAPSKPADRWRLPFFSSNDKTEFVALPEERLAGQALQPNDVSSPRPSATLTDAQEENKRIFGLIPRWGSSTDEQPPRLAEKPDSSRSGFSFFNFGIRR